MRLIMATKVGSKRITATLIRGKFYSYKGNKFHENKPQEVPKELALELEELVDEVVDRENEIIEKPRFKINYNAAPVAPSQELEGVRKKKRPLQTSATQGGDLSLDDLNEGGAKKKPTIRQRKRLV